MIITKKYCDLCKEEVKEFYGTYWCSLRNERNSSDDAGYIMSMCKDCYKRKLHTFPVTR